MHITKSGSNSNLFEPHGLAGSSISPLRKQSVYVLSTIVEQPLLRYAPSMSNYEAPFNVPGEIFWDITEGAELRRAEWILDARNEVPVEEALHVMPFRDTILLKVLSDKLSSSTPSDPEYQQKEQKAIFAIKSLLTHRWSGYIPD